MQLKDKYRNFWIHILGYEKHMRSHEIDFHKPWWQAILVEKWRFLAILVSQIITSISIYLQPYFLVLSIESRSAFTVFILLFVTRAGVQTVQWIMYGYNNPILQLNIRESVRFNANKSLLTTDPINHSTRESGKAISKVQRGSNAFENILDIITFEIVPLITGLSVTIFGLLSQNLQLGLTAVFFITVLIIMGAVSSVYNNSSFLPKVHEQEDEVKQAEIENLQQSGFIRSIFATEFQLKRLSRHQKETKTTTAGLWTSQHIFFQLVVTVYNLSLAVLVWQIIELININQLQITTAIALGTTYLYGTDEVFRSGRIARNLSKAYAEIQDLYTFIREFGEQTYSVISEK